MRRPILGIHILAFLFAGVLRAQSGWSHQKSDTEANLRGVCFTDANTGTVVGESGTILRTTDGGATWRLQSSGTTSPLHAVSFTDASTGTVAGPGGILRTTDGGDNWVSLSGYSHYSISFSDANNGAAVGVIGTFRRTTNGGTEWTNIGETMYSTFYGVSMIEASRIVAVGEQYYPGHPESSPYIQGFSWGGWVGPIGPLYSNTLFGVSVVDSTKAVAVGKQGTVVRTTDRGSTWISSTVTTADLFGVSFVDPSVGFAAGANGTILRSTDGGVTWRRQLTGTRVILRGIFFTDSKTGTAVGDGGTILRTTSGGVGSEEHTGETAVSHTLWLGQNHPNPFNPSTKIVYRVTSREFVSLRVHDVLGKVAATLVDEVKEPGLYEVTWNASDFPSGVYFYRLVAGQFSETKKLLLLK